MNTKAKKVLARIGLVLLGVIVVALGIRAVFNYTTGKKLEAYLEDARAKGIPLSLKEIAPACDEVDNGARFWKAAEALFVIPEGKDKGLTYKILLNRTIDDFFHGSPLKEDSRTKLADLIALNRGSLDLVLEAGGRPCIISQGDWTSLSPDMEVSRLVKTMQAIRLIGIDAVLRADLGQAKEGLDECLMAMTFVRKTLAEPSLINSLVALSSMKSLIVCADRILQEHDIDPATLTSWKGGLDARGWRANFMRCIQADRVRNLERGLQVIRGDRVAFKLDEWDGDALTYWLTRPLQKSQLVWVQNQFLDLEKRVDLSYPEVSEWAKERAREPIPWHFRISGFKIIEFQSSFMKEATLEAMMLTTKAGLACKIYKKQSGHYPESLAVLVPSLLDRVPIDPFSGKPLIYRLEDSGVLIYSVGANGKDDGGRGTYQITQLVMDKDDDWAWKEAETPPLGGRK